MPAVSILFIYYLSFKALSYLGLGKFKFLQYDL